MVSNNIEVIDGFRICWLSTESKEMIREDLASGKIHGIGFNPFRGWSRRLCDLLDSDLVLQALVLPFADRVEFTGDLLSQQRSLKMLLLAEFSGFVHIDINTLRTLRVQYTERITFGFLSNLETLYFREPTEDLLQELSSIAPALTRLELNGGLLFHLHGVESLGLLRQLELSNFKRLATIANLSKLKLEVLIMESVRIKENLSAALAQLRSLRTLRLLDCGKIEDFDFLAKMNLEDFRCSRTVVPSRTDPALSRIKSVYIG